MLLLLPPLCVRRHKVRPRHVERRRRVRRRRRQRHDHHRRGGGGGRPLRHGLAQAEVEGGAPVPAGVFQGEPRGGISGKRKAPKDQSRFSVCRVSRVEK